MMMDQFIHEVHILVQAKQLRVEVKDSHIKVQVEKEGGYETLVDGTLKWKVHSAESVWTLVPGDHVHINLDKAQERWWESCFQGKEGVGREFGALGFSYTSLLRRGL